MTTLSVTEVKQALFDAFRDDHARMGRSLHRLGERLRARDLEGAREVAREIDREHGAHVAFEEHDFYPALIPFLDASEIESLYADHARGRTLLECLVAPAKATSIDERERQTLLEQVDAMETHVAECGELFGAMGGLDETAQRRLYRHLCDWRSRAPNWTALPAVRAPSDARGTGRDNRREASASAAPIARRGRGDRRSRLARSPVARRAADYAAVYERRHVRSGHGDGPTLWVEDHRGIDFVDESLARGFEYRSLGLAGDRDLLLVSRPRDRAFEVYQQTGLGLGSPAVLSVSTLPSDPARLCAACLRDEAVLERLAAVAASAGQFIMAPYRSSGDVWQLASRVAALADVPVQVAASPPPLARAANDKLWFADCVRRLLGDEALPLSLSVYAPSAAAAALRRLASRYATLVIKTPRSAGALGNLVLEADTLQGHSLADIRALVLDSLAALGWADSWPLLVGVWEGGAIASPSAQCWVPRIEAGSPTVEALFEQRLAGEQGVFVGATNACLEPAVHARLEAEAIGIARHFQDMGYFGRVSFDALILADGSRPRIHWIECNARWGGVSIPMGVVRRLGLDPARDPLWIGQAQVDATRYDFASLHARVRHLDFRPATRCGVVWLTPPESGRSNADFVAIGSTGEHAASLARELHEALDTGQKQCKSARTAECEPGPP